MVSCSIHRAGSILTQHGIGRRLELTCGGCTMPKIVSPMVGLLSNAEVLQVLHDRGAAGKSLNARALPSEKLVYQYLFSQQGNASVDVRDRSTLSDFMGKLQPFHLSKAEVLMILNICPTQPVEVFQLVDKCDERLNEEQVEELLNLVSQCLRH